MDLLLVIIFLLFLVRVCVGKGEREGGVLVSVRACEKERRGEKWEQRHRKMDDRIQMERERKKRERGEERE